ncbi:MAG: ATP-dependent protease ATPase subunit HslU [Cytophagales bacterium]|nr:ATP-dependent protease ATPase subunit HslU [Cytophagales bacterium]
MNEFSLPDSLTPKAIVEALDLYIIGQKVAKQNVAIALRNRWRWMKTPENMRREMVPSNILMIGATGVGKTEVARRLAKLVQAPFVKVEASKFTEVGYVGRDVESMVRDLATQSVNMVRTEWRERLRKKAQEQVEERLLEALIRSDSKNSSLNLDSLDEEARSGLMKRIQRGDMDKQKVEIEVSLRPKGMDVGFVGPQGMDEAGMSSMQDMISNLMPKKTKKRKLSIGEARKILLEDVLNTMMDMDDIKEEAIKRTQHLGIIFIDEIDKVVSRGGQGGIDVSREGVQRDLLPIVEGSAVQTKYGVIHTDNILFIAAGAFHHVKPSDLIPELQGRFAIRVELKSLTEKDFFRILKEPKNALSKQYIALFEAERVKLVLSDEALNTVARVAFQLNQEVEDIGARRLSMVMNHLFNQELFDMPDQVPPNSIIELNVEEVERRLKTLIEDKDLSQYIL